MMKFITTLIFSLVLIAAYVSAVGIGTLVTDPSDCDSGYVQFIANVNGSGGQIYCSTGESFSNWATSVDTQNGSTSGLIIKPISEESLRIQADLAQSATIWTQADELYWDAKFNGAPEWETKFLGIKEYSTQTWRYLWGFIILVLETLKLIFYIAELLVIIYIIFTLIPEQFFKMRDGIAKMYLKRYAT